MVAEVGFEARQSRVTTYRTSRIVVAYRLRLLGSADSLLYCVNRRKNDYQSFFLRLQVIRPQRFALGLITSKVVEHKVTTATKKKELGTPNGVPSSFGCGGGI